MVHSSPQPPPAGGGRLYLFVLAGVAVGLTVGALWPAAGVALKPLGDGFIALIKMLIAPIVFCTVVLGIAGMGDLRQLGRVGGKAFLYFEVVSTVALGVGLLVANGLRPGAGFGADPASLDAQAVSEYTAQAREMNFVDHLLHIIPKTFTDAFTANGDLLQVLLLAILFGVALAAMGAEEGRAVHGFLEATSKALFRCVGMVMYLAPLGACGAMAFTIGKYGLSSLGPLASLMGCFYLTCLIFVLVVLGGICAALGINILRLLVHIKGELLTIIGTSSSESVLVPIMQKLEGLGCSRSVVGLVVPYGYSFNLDGTNIYMTLAALFIAQALGIDLSLGQQLGILGVAMLTSKGASGVTGAGFVTLAATLAVEPAVPVAGMALILGIDRFMSEARALTNCIGNVVATLVVARWEGELDRERLAATLASR
jgi:aerobic C4-dicarboxylate transport protein